MAALGTVLLVLLLSGTVSGWPALALGPGLSGGVRAQLPGRSTQQAAGAVIPINQQPFYPELLDVASRWADAPLGK